MVEISGKYNTATFNNSAETIKAQKIVVTSSEKKFVIYKVGALPVL